MSKIENVEKDYIFGIKGRCTYCGEDAEEIDHCIPRGLTGSIKTNKSRGVRTYSCAECNSALSGRAFSTFYDRMSYARKKVEQRVSKASKWTQKEIDELDYSLATVIVAGSKKKEKSDSRMKWLNTKWYAQILKELRSSKIYDFNETMHAFFKDFEGSGNREVGSTSVSYMHLRYIKKNPTKTAKEIAELFGIREKVIQSIRLGKIYKEKYKSIT